MCTFSDDIDLDHLMKEVSAGLPCIEVSFSPL